MLAKVFPYGFLSDAYKAAQAVLLQDAIEDRYTQTDQWRIARTERRGVTIHDYSAPTPAIPCTPRVARPMPRSSAISPAPEP